MLLSELHLSATQALWPLLAAFAVLVGFVAWAYGRSAGSTSVRSVCTALKIIGIAALVLCLLEPLWSKQRARPGSNYFVVLADNSQGLQIHDRGQSQSRGELMKKSLADTGDGAWQQTLAETFQLRRYSFDSRLQPVNGFGELDFNGSATALHTTLRNISERYRGQPLAGVIMFTDGNATDSNAGLDVAGLPPIYSVVAGSDDVLRDLSVQKVAVSQTAFEDAPVTIQTDVSADGFRGEEIVVQLLDSTGKKIEEQKQRPDRSEQTLAFRFRLKPTERGLNFYEVRAAARSDLNNPTNKNSEATQANNNRAAVVDRGTGPYRVLYVAGRPNWEFKFLNRALADDEQIQLIALIRIARRERKFEFIGRRGETSNPLFRGFGQTNEDTERYDQPVLVRLNTRDEAELKGGFPKTAEDLYQYQAIVLDDLESEFFTRDQMSLVQKFVSERGGGLLMLGGAESFREGKYVRTPIGDMLPVYLDRTESMKPSGPLKLSLTKEGWIEPWIRLRDNESEERSRLDKMPGFEVLNEATAIKPGASVLATVADAQAHTFPALVAQRFGGGRSAALLVGDLWRWGFREESMHKDMDKLWRQMMRWLVTDVPNRFEVHVEPKESSDSVLLQVRARDKTFQPLDNASVQLTVTAIAEAGAKITSSATNTVKMNAEAATEPGVYEATYITRKAGAYRVDAIIADANGAEVGRASAGWTSDPAAEEFRSLKPNRALLESLSKRTGGEVIEPSKLAAFAKNLPNRKAPITENASIPLWHTPAMFLFALACLVAEWGVRRWKGLP
jgi:uncharacterized membrane protein